MPKILHTADLHLGRSWADLPAAVAARLTELHWQCFEDLARAAVENGVLALVVAGDLFDKAAPPVKLAERVRGVFRRLIAQGVGVVVVPGTHDPAGAARSAYRADALGGARVFLGAKLGERFVIGRGNAALAFQGLAWDPQGTPRNFLADYRRGPDNLPEVLVLHGEVGAGETRRGRDLPAAAEALAGCGADYVALGHRHQLARFAREERLWGAYPGTPFGLAFKEPELGPRSAGLVELAPPKAPRFEPLRTTAVEWRRLNADLGSFASRDELYAAIADHAGPERLLRVELAGAASFPVSPEAAEAEFGPSFLYLAVEDASVEVPPEALAVLAAEQSVRGIFARRMQARLAAARDAADRAEVSAALREGLRALAEGGEAHT